jgi:hypothetical protein
MSCTKMFREHLGSPNFLVGFVFLVFLVFCFVYHRPVSCVPNVASVSGLSILFSLTFIHNKTKLK